VKEAEGETSKEDVASEEINPKHETHNS